MTVTRSRAAAPPADTDERRALTARRRVLFISPDAVGERMRGLGIRYTELARALAPSADVVVATGAPDAGGAAPAGVRVTGYAPHAPAALRAQIAVADMVVAPPQWPLVTAWLRRCPARVVFDLHPETLETLEVFAGRRAALRRLLNALTLDRLEDALRSGHHFVCSGEAQRDLWIGMLLAHRLVSPAAYDRDPSLRDVVDLVPFGAPAEPPRASGPGVRAAFAQIAPEDEIVLWNGGVWRWYDAATAIRAVARLAERRPGVRLVFMSASASGGAEAALARARALAQTLGVLDTNVLFAERWVPYEQRAAWMLEADCALVAGVDHLETRFAFRTRFLDCFWAGVPVVCTRGDELAERVARDELGAVAAIGDHEELGRALEVVLDRGRDAYEVALARAAATFAWPLAVEPLRRWLDSPTPPRRLSEHGRAPLRRPGHLLRSGGYRAARRTLETLRLPWPSL